MAMRRFGFIKHLPKPKTEKDWDRVWRQNKIELPSVEKIVLTLSDKGAGQTGARRFKTYVIPPIKHWNPKIAVEINRDVEKPVVPSLMLTLQGGETKTIDLKGLHVDKIRADLVELAGAANINSLTTPVHTDARPPTLAKLSL